MDPGPAHPPTSAFGMRFLHIADVHLDSAFATRTPEVRERLRDAARDAFRGAVDVAVEDGLDAFLIAGDLFDSERLSFRTEAFLVREFGRLEEAGVHVVYATGNHDPGRSGRRAGVDPWPANVRVVGGRSPERIRIPDASGDATAGWVTAAGHPSARETMDLARTFPRPAGEGAQVGLLHTQVHEARAAGEHHPYAPSELAWLERSGYHYWALGHVHVRQRLSDDPSIHYPGNPQGRTPAESGAKGALCVDLTDPRAPRVDFVPLGPVRWETVAVDRLGDARSVDAVVRRVAEVWGRERERDPWPPADGWMVRIRMSGPSPLWRLLRTPDERRTLEEEIQNALGALDVEVDARRAHAPLRPERHAERRDVLGEALRLVDEVRAEATVVPGLDAAHLAACEEDPELDPDTYLRELLASIPVEIVARLLTGEARDRAIEDFFDTAADGPGDAAAEREEWRLAGDGSVDAERQGVLDLPERG